MRQEVKRAIFWKFLKKLKINLAMSEQYKKRAGDYCFGPCQRPSSGVLRLEVFSPRTPRALNEKLLGLKTLDTFIIMTIMIKIIYLHT